MTPSRRACWMSSTAWLLLVVFGAGACAGLLGLRPSGRRTFEHRAHVLKGIQCVTCHDTLERAGDTDPISVPTSAGCRSCHQKPHNESECGACHGQASAREAAALARNHLRFEHKTHLARVRGDCVRCHLDVQQEAHTLRPAMATCMSCHAHRDQWSAQRCDPCHVDLTDEGTKPEDHFVHDPDFARSHATRAAADSDLCTTCHTQRFCTGCHGGDAAPAIPERLAFDQPSGPGLHRAGFTSRHADEARGDPGLCVSCHSPQACSQCHERKRVGAAAVSGDRNSPHPPGWIGLPGQSNEHGRAAWRDPALCASCHGGAGEALCVGCHRVGAPGGNPHAPGWSSRLRPRLDRPCVLCHGVAP